MHKVIRLLFVLVLWGPPLKAAPQPLTLAEAMQEQSALATAMTNQFAPPRGGAPTDSNRTSLIVLGAALLFGIVALRLLAPWVGRGLNRRLARGKAASGLMGAAEPEDELISELVASLSTGPSATPGRAAGEISSSLCEVRPTAELAEPVRGGDSVGEFLSAAQKSLAAMRKLISEVSQANDEADRGKLLRELLQEIHLLRGSAGLPEVLPVWQMACALEGLVKQLANEPTNVNPSTLRTVASAVDFLHALCVRGLDPNLAKDPTVRLLAVDDDPVSRQLMAVALKKALTQPDLAADGEGALKLAAARNFTSALTTRKIR